jgi:putative restriction endonuclease
VDNKGQVIISFKPEYLGLYLENYDGMHQSSEKSLLKLIDTSNETEETESTKGDIFEIEKQKFTVTHRRFKRDVMFRKLIAETYANRCAICGIQLDLVEAAHIIPHSHKKGTDDPTNGVCLCTLHHKAYDKGLIYFDTQYNIKLNNSKMRYLEKVKKDGGIMKFKGLQFDKLSLPTSKLYYPSKDFIKVANELRGIVE